MNKEEILAQIQNQKLALKTSPFKDVKRRIEVLKLLYKNIELMEDEICDALKKDLNKSASESYMAEVGMVLSEIGFMIKHIKRFAKTKRVHTPLAQFPSKSFQMPCAYGQVLIISPWNYPFMLALDPMVDAISAGNSVVLKPSASSPNVSAVIDKLIKMTFDPKQVLVILGGRSECDFLLDLDFDYIFFTGSTRVGKTILQKAAEHYTPVTLEMGGKSPCVVDETANIPLSARRIVFGKFLNCGQTCVAPDFIFCAKTIKDKLINELKKQIAIQYTSDPIANENYPKMINEKQFESVSGLIEKDKIVFGGKSDKTTLKIEPTILDCSFDDKAMQEEIFGPVLPIVTFENVDKAIEKINSMPKPLAFYIFSSSKKNQNKFLNMCDFGGGCVNDTIIHLASSKLGFGGVKQSGMGAYHGKIGFDTFTHYKSIVDKKTWLDLPIRYQPHTKTKIKLMKKFMK